MLNMYSGKAEVSDKKGDCKEPVSTASTSQLNLTNQAQAKVCDAVTHSEMTSEGDSSAKTSEVRLRRELGLIEGVAMIVGIVIGSGIFVSPKGVIYYTGSVGISLGVWAASGIVAMIGAISFAELSMMIPLSGGVYSYLLEAFGSLPAFLYMWVTVGIMNAGSCAILALTFTTYLIQPFFECSEIPDVAARLISAALICFLAFLNCLNVKWVMALQNIFTATKVLALIVIIVAGILHILWGHTDNYQDPLLNSNWSPPAIATAFYQALYSYAGWENLYFVVEEIKDPERNVPLSIMISTAFVTVVYVLTNAAYLAVLTPAEVLASDAVAITFANQMLGVMAWIMPIFVICSTLGSLNGSVYTASRLVFVGARQGHFPEAFSLIQAKYLTPVPAVLLTALLSLLMFVTSDIGTIINYTTFAGTLTQFACMCSLFWFRKKQPDRKRPFKVWTILPVIFFLTTIFLLVMPMVESPVDVGASLGVVCTGLPVYYFAIHRKDIANKARGILRKITYVHQMLFLGLPEDKTEPEKRQ